MSEASNGFEPINDDHAVESATFVCRLNYVLQPSDIRKIEDKHYLIREDLPAVGMSTDNGSQASAIPAGIQFSTLRPDGSPVWSLRVFGNEIAVDCTRYGRWKNTWERARKFINFALKVLFEVQNDIRIMSVALQVVDKFRNSQEVYDISALFRPNNPIPAGFLQDKGIWHCNTGWIDNNNQTLNRLNMDSSRGVNIDVTGQRSAQIYVTVDHQQQKFLTEPIPISDAESGLDKIMVELHDSNKQMARTLFNDQICKRIGLGEAC